MPKVTEKEFERHIKNEDIKRLYFIYGDDVYNITYIRNNLVKHIAGVNPNGFDYIEFDGQNIDIEKLGISLEQYPIVLKRKCVLVKNLDVDLLNNGELEKLYGIISDIPEYCCLIISQTTVKIDSKCSSKWKKILNLLEKTGLVLNLEKKTKTSIQKQIIKWANEHNKELSLENATLMCNICGDDLIKLKNEINKICCFNEQKEISEDSIKLLVKDSLETNVFEICKMLSNKRYKEALKILHSLFFQKEEPIAILGVISGIYVDMYRVKVAIKYGLKSTEVLNIFDYKRKEFRITSAERNSMNMSIDNLRKIIELLLQTDLKLKSSRVNPQLLLELVIVKIIILQNNNR